MGRVVHWVAVGLWYAGIVIQMIVWGSVVVVLFPYVLWKWAEAEAVRKD